MSPQDVFPQRLGDALGVKYPILLAGMGGVAGPELVAAVSNAGGGGILGLYKSPAERIRMMLREMDGLTEAPYGINLVPQVLDESELRVRVEAVLESSGPQVFVSFFGLPSRAVADMVRQSGRQLVVQVGTVATAQEAVDQGAEVVIVQGTEAGGHLLGTDELEKLLLDVRQQLPDTAIVVAGGIATGDAFARLVKFGADGVCCGTLFIPTIESRAHPTYKAAVLESRGGDTEITDIFDIGWPHCRHRVVRTPRVVEGRTDPETFIARTEVYGKTDLIPRYSSAVPTIETSGLVEEMALYCGTSCSEVVREEPAATVVARFVDEYCTAV